MLKAMGKTFTIITTTNIIGLYVYIRYKSKSSNKLNIVLDLDETIIHSDKVANTLNYNDKNIIKPDIKRIQISTSERQIWIRPFVKTLLPVLAQFNNLYLFTKATKPYADTILEETKLDKYFKERKYRDSCEKTCKDLNKFMNNIEKLNFNTSLWVLVDDKLSNKCGQQNFYHIPRFNCYVHYDYEFVKVFGYILWLNIKNDIGMLETKKN